MLDKEYHEPVFHQLPEQNVHSLVRWHSEMEQLHRRMKEACIAELALRGLIVLEEFGNGE